MTNTFKFKLATLALAAIIAVPVTAQAAELSTPNKVQSQSYSPQSVKQQKRKIKSVVEPLSNRRASNLSRAGNSRNIILSDKLSYRRTAKNSRFLIAPKSQPRAFRMPVLIDPEYAD